MGRPLCMHTYSRMFNTCIIPGEECDELVSFPHDAKHIIVLRNNCIWTLQVLGDDGNELPLADILRYASSTGAFSDQPGRGFVYVMEPC